MKCIPKTAKPVTAFQWKPNVGRLINDLASFLNGEGFPFELIGNAEMSASIIIGYDDDDGDQVRVDPNEWVVFDHEGVKVIKKSADFYEQYEVVS